ncbi:SMI1/KNR4 family protein [Hymenobacter sp. ASUV-10]|uniref:SMI1/KNR4 family protein n=1 Tax=Hymenobacter aranciens TaxID=3063996 RepID=A0ABT9B869_9BACT|nr:SMI1/KNR4 family protein [Hymenobacter sp. ASUV-10]MDO7873909.1 SMI1/KNR4 family protein [Hymenobacter sp. ASUV-10]
MQDFLEKLLDELIETGTDLYIPTTGASIGIFENICQLKLPADLKELYRFCNGFGPDKEDQFQVLSLTEATMELVQYGKGQRGSRFVLAEYMLYCDWWEVELTPEAETSYRIVNAGHRSGSPLVLTHSIEEFLTRYLAGGVFGNGGLYDWHEEKELELRRLD